VRTFSIVISPAMHSILALTVFAGIASCQNWKIGQQVKTTSGTVIGHAADWKPEVSEYLGIRFAEPPVGKLRFAAPVSYKGNETITATKFGLGCPENVGGKAVTMTDVGDDCLNLNVWAKPQSGEKAKAVMVRRNGSLGLQWLTYICTDLDLRWWFRIRKIIYSDIQRRSSCRRARRCCRQR
jgi:hypothetical protein